MSTFGIYARNFVRKNESIELPVVTKIRQPRPQLLNFSVKVKYGSNRPIETHTFAFTKEAALNQICVIEVLDEGVPFK